MNEREKAARELELPVVVGNRYKLLELRGGGGMARVYRATDLTLEREVAVKVWRPELHEGPELHARFQREARITSQLTDPHIVEVYDFGIDPDLGPFLVMQFLHGQSLRERLATSGKLPFKAALQMATQLIQALLTAHQKGIVHRDLKPANVFLDVSGARLHAHVLDFGIARIYRGDTGAPGGAGSVTFTVPGPVLGTPRYTSPEQLAGQPVDARSDLYSAAVVIFEAMTGQLPSATGKKLRELCPDATQNVQELLEQCLKPSPTDRPPNAVEVYLRLAEIGRASGTLNLPPAAMERRAAARSRVLDDLPIRSAPAGGRLPSLAYREGRLGRPRPTIGSLLGAVGGLLAAPFVGLASAVSAAGNAIGSLLAPGPRAEGTGARPAQPAVRRHTDVSFPSRVPLGRVCSLRVQIVPAEEVLPTGEVRELPRPHPHDATLELQAPREQQPLRVSVCVAAENFEVQGRARAELLVPAAGPSGAAHFPLRPLALGSGRVMIDFEQDGVPVGSVDLRPTVTAGEERSGQAPSEGGVALRDGPLAAPDVILKVFEHRLAGAPGRLHFVLSSCHPALRDLPVLDGDLGSQDLRAEVAVWVEEQLRGLGELAGRPERTPEEVTRALTAAGHALYDQLLPAPLKDLCWALRQRGARSLLVLSDEPHIPWELIKPYRLDEATGDLREDGDFWGATFALTRWLRGRPPAQSLALGHVVALAAGGPAQGGEGQASRDLKLAPPALAAPATVAAAPALPSALAELDVLRSLSALGARVEVLPALRRHLREAFDQGGFDVLHVAGHGTFGGAPTAEASAVYLEDGPFRAADLSPGLGGSLRRREPLVVLNACHSGRLGFSLTRLGAWGAQFVRLGCGAFVGTLWPVTDQAALAFARAFYRLLGAGLPIGEAVAQARLLVRDGHPNDPTWLAYCCFADPTARLTRALTSAPAAPG
jgi:serine/threonine-protein kinase